MGCRCAERRAAIRVIANAVGDAMLGKGANDRALIESNAKFIAKSAIEDVGSEMRRRIVETRSRLQGRSR